MQKRKQLVLNRLLASDLPFRVLEDAYWHPQEAHLKPEFSEKFRDQNEAEGRKEYQRLKGFWRKREIWITYAFEALLLASSPRLLATVFNRLIPSAGLVAPEVYACNLRELKADIGVPDFIIGDRDALVLGELKVGAAPTSHRYTFEQYSKFMYFSAVCKLSESSGLPSNVTHLVMCPEIAPEKICSDYAQWRPSLVGNKLIVDPLMLRVRDRKKRVSDFTSWKSQLQRFLVDPALNAHNSPRPDSEQLARDLQTTMIADTFVYSWNEFATVFNDTAGHSEGHHLALSMDQIRRMASPDAA